jgi:beta-glucosidase
MGDQTDVALHHGNNESLALLKSLKARGVPTGAVLLSGRPLYVNPQINQADALSPPSCRARRAMASPMC